MNFQKISVDELYFSEASGTHPANTHFHFSFADYYDPGNVRFGVLRVLNDDMVKPNSGFGKHPHRDMEIFSYIVDGQLTHWDSTGNHEVLHRGDVQYISAGTGVSHSELNEQNEWCRFLQIWILPEARSLPVRYGLVRFSAEERQNRLLHIICGSKNDKEAPIHLFQDVNVFVSELTSTGMGVSYSLAQGRQAYMKCIEGDLGVSEETSLGMRDALKVFGPAELEFGAVSDQAHLIMIEMKHEE